MRKGYFIECLICENVDKLKIRILTLGIYIYNDGTPSGKTEGLNRILYATVLKSSLKELCNALLNAVSVLMKENVTFKMNLDGS